MCTVTASATYIAPLSAANNGKRDWIASRRLDVSTHRLVGVVMKEGVRLPHASCLKVLS